MFLRAGIWKVTLTGMLCRSNRLVCLLLLAWMGAVTFAHAVPIEWKPPPDKVTLLVVNAHPDDEGIFFGGAMVYYPGVLQVPVLLLSMTSGDWNTNNLLIREEELRKAAWEYGLRHEPLFPRFRDVPSHSMAGNPYPNKIDATWDYWADGVLQGDGSDVAAGREKAINYIAEQIRRYRPEVIITHDFNGEYGHDNHKATAIAVTEAYHVAADPTATATNLVGLPPWQARKLYVHLLSSNQLFHIGWETPYDELGGKTPREVANDGLDYHVSQNRPRVSTHYLTGERFDGYDSERWGLYASTVGWDTPVTNGWAVGTFLENLVLTNDVNSPPQFFPNPLRFPPAIPTVFYHGHTLARFATDPDKVGGDVLTFTKVSGPAWLTVAAHGALSGTPDPADIGLNTFEVRVTDAAGANDEATLTVAVTGPLVALWNCDEGAGGLLGDTSDHDFHGTLSQGATWAEGRHGGALSLDGTTGHVAAVNLPLGRELTIAAWIRPDNLTGDRAIIGETGGYTFKTRGTSLCFTTPGIRDHVYAAGLVLGQWQHVAVTFQAELTNGCTFYLNGQLAGVVNASAKNSSSNVTWIGRNQWGQYFAGRLDDIRVYRTVLSAAEVQALYANTPPVFTQNPLPFPGASAQAEYSGQTLAGHATDPDVGEILSFRKVSGPAWLNVANDGSLGGTPAIGNVGTNFFRVRVRDSQSAAADTTVQLVVAYPLTRRIEVARVEGGVWLEFVGEPLRRYQLVGTANLAGTWLPITAITTDTLGRGSWTDLADRGLFFFYRLEE